MAQMVLSKEGRLLGFAKPPSARINFHCMPEVGTTRLFSPSSAPGARAAVLLFGIVNDPVTCHTSDTQLDSAERCGRYVPPLQTTSPWTRSSPNSGLSPTLFAPASM